MLPTVDIKGNRPAASEVDQILRLNVASVWTAVGHISAVGVLIRDGRTTQFMTASCFRRILYMDPALFFFASACCEGIRMAVSLYEPTAIVLESSGRSITVEPIAGVESTAIFQNQEYSRRIQSCCLPIGPSCFANGGVGDGLQGSSGLACPLLTSVGLETIRRQLSRNLQLKGAWSMV